MRYFFAKTEEVLETRRKDIIELHKKIDDNKQLIFEKIDHYYCQKEK